MKKRVLVGMSGGVDSSVAAVLLQEQGYEAVGVTFIFTEDFDTTDSIKVCEKLGIEHHIIDYKKVFKETVIDKFIKDYQSGITPNPCILCNRYVKFNFLYEKMLEYNCDFMATGHYAKVINGKLYKSADLNKDQTYFLCEITKEQLSRVLFPLEGIDKSEVRKIAEKHNLINASKKDSTDVCFITSSFKDYIKTEVEDKKGPVINVINNEKVGEHSGLSSYTIGQRKGLNIGGMTDRMFVVGKDMSKNTLYVAMGDNNDYLISTSCLLNNINWFNDEKLTNCTAKFRYRQNEVEVKLEWQDDGNLIVNYPAGVKSVTPGQICAIYNGDECLGGGVIKEVRKDGKKLWYL